VGAYEVLVFTGKGFHARSTRIVLCRLSGLGVYVRYVWAWSIGKSFDLFQARVLLVYGLGGVCVHLNCRILHPGLTGVH
jgi:hypothetical protein